jgi:hypothetical protein
VGPQPLDDPQLQVADYCRAIEAYLCQKNDGHLVRVVGPSFVRVSRWAAEGVPLKVALRGIDRCFERYYRKGPRRRPVHIDFCEADVLELFDEWRRTVGLATAVGEDARERRERSLPAHLQRVLARLTQASAAGALGGRADDVFDRLSEELDRARAAAKGLRGEPRRALIDRLASLDAALMEAARASIPTADRASLQAEADEQLAAFRPSMGREAYDRAREAAVDRLIRERLNLPVVAFD